MESISNPHPKNIAETTDQGYVAKRHSQRSFVDFSSWDPLLSRLLYMLRLNLNRSTFPLMQKTILLVSRDGSSQETRALILEHAGYRTVHSETISSAVPLAAGSQMAIIGHSLNPSEQDEFVKNAPEINPNLYVLYLRYGLVQPESLLPVMKT
jgi:hypothetical protein